MNEDERARRAQYREQMHYAHRYSGFLGYYHERKDEAADRLHGLPDELQAAILLAVIALIALAFILGGGITWWLFLSVPVFIASAALLVASLILFIKDL